MAAEWGLIDKTRADLMAPGDPAGHDRCRARQWGVSVGTVVVYGSLRTLRAWARSIDAQLPEDRGADQPLVAIDVHAQTAWLTTRLADDEDWEPRAWTVCDLMEAIAVDPMAAGWTLGYDVAGLWADLDERTGGLMAGVTLAASRLNVGIGEPLRDADFTVRPQPQSGSVEVAAACLTTVAHRINQSY